MTQTFTPRELLPRVPRPGPTVRPAELPAQVRAAEVRLGRIRLGSAVGYLLEWAAVLVVVWVAMWSAAYWVLLRTGALGSVSRSLATILGVRTGPSGLLPFFTWPHALTALVVTGAALGLVWFVSAVGALLVHNALTAMTRGPRVQLRR